MNCNDAFDALTDPLRWTDPLNGTDPELQQHLAHCPRCRQMEETLSPALHLFESERDEPGPGSFDTAGQNSGAGSDAVAPHAVRSTSRDVGWLNRRTSSSGSAGRTRGRVLAVAMTGFLLLGIASSWMSPNAAIAPSPRSTAMSDCFWLHPDSVRSEARPPAASHVVSACVACHLSGGGTTARVQMLACVQCHAQASGVELDTQDQAARHASLRNARHSADACPWVRTSG